jgi:hypothetical protein
VICARIRPLDYFYAAPMIERGEMGALIATVIIIDEVLEHGAGRFCMDGPRCVP